MTLINYILSIARPPPPGTQIPVQVLSSPILSWRAGFQVLVSTVTGNNSSKGTSDSFLLELLPDVGLRNMALRAVKFWSRRTHYLR